MLRKNSLSKVLFAHVQCDIIQVKAGGWCRCLVEVDEGDDPKIGDFVNGGSRQYDKVLRDGVNIWSMTDAHAREMIEMQ